MESPLRLLGSRLGSPQHQQWLVIAGQYLQTTLNTTLERMDWIREKSYEDCTYVDLPQIGVSFAFDEKDGGRFCTAVHVFKDVRQYRYCPDLKLEFKGHRISLDWTIKDFVLKLGEPNEKKGGRVPIVLYWTQDSLTLQVNFLLSDWNDPNNTTNEIVFYNS